MAKSHSMFSKKKQSNTLPSASTTFLALTTASSFLPKVSATDVMTTMYEIAAENFLAQGAILLVAIGVGLFALSTCGSSNNNNNNSPRPNR